MRLTCMVLVFLVLTLKKCESDDDTTTELTIIKTTTDIVIEERKSDTNWGTRGFYGGSYYNYSNKNPTDVHYIHGTYQPPTTNYYYKLKYTRENDTDTLNYYLGFGLSKMTDKDYKYEDFHNYYHDLSRNITENETILSDVIIGCHPNATFLCPENTETVCLLNGTIYCMSRMSAVSSCPDNDTMACVNTTVPCFQNCSKDNNNLEMISLPCLATINVVDVYENHGTTLSRVGDTFIIVPALDEKDKIYCVSVVVDPVAPAVK